MTTAVRQARRRSHAPDGTAQHRGWLDLIEIRGPFLSLPVLRQTWPTLDALEKPTRDALRREHSAWRDDPYARSGEWIQWVLTELLGWGDELRDGPDDLEAVGLDVPEHETRVVPSFALVEVGEDVKPATTRLLGLICPPGHAPTARVPGSPWAATYADRLAAVCRHHGVELGLATDGRWWALVWAPKDKATGVAVFDTIAWPELAERDVVRAFSSILCRSRFFGVSDDERLPALLHDSLGSQEDITEALGSQVREAVELLVAALGRQDLLARERGLPDLAKVEAHEVYRGAVSVMMRIVFLLFAEERRLLPADNDLYASTYSAGQLCAELERRALEGSEDDLEHTSVAWHRLLALFAAVHGGVDHPRLTMHAHDGSLFDPDTYVWLDMPVDDRTVLHMLRAVQYVEIGSGRSKERRSLSFRSLGVEEIGYVYEGLLAYDAFRAVGVVVGLQGKRGSEPEVELRELERLATGHSNLTTLGAEFSTRFKDSGLGTAPAIAKKMKPLTGASAEDARRKLLAAAQGDAKLAVRLQAFYGLLREDLRELPMVIQPGALYVTDSSRRRNTGTHYTPRELAEEVVLHALEPLVYEPGPLQTADTRWWKLKTAEEILALNVADIAMGSAAFLVAAARYLGARLIEAWTRAGDERAQAYSISDVKSDEDPVVIDARRQVIEHCLYGVDINPMAVEMAKLSLWLVSMDPIRPFTFLDDRLVEGDSLLGVVSLEQLKQMELGSPLPKQVDDDSGLFDWEEEIQEAADVSAHERELLASMGIDEKHPLESLDLKRAKLYEAWSRVDKLRLISNLLVGSALYDRRRRNEHLVPQSGSLPSEKSRGVALLTASNLLRDVGERAARELAHSWLSTDSTAQSFNRRPVHWPLVFPEVAHSGGFDAIVGNPPYLGGKLISGAYGHCYREYLIDMVARGVRGSADLVTYFLLRADSLLKSSGQQGIVAKDTMAEGEAQSVGLGSLLDRGRIIRRSVKSEPWPGKNADIRFCAVWITSQFLELEIPKIADGVAVKRIDASLSPAATHLWEPAALEENSKQAFVGSYVLGSGFFLSEDEADTIIDRDPSSRDVIRSWVGGEELNQNPGCTPGGRVIDLGNLSEHDARKYGEVFRIVEDRVRPVRQRVNSDGQFALRKPLPQRYWQFADRKPALYSAIKDSPDAIAIALVSSTLIPVMVASNQVFTNKVVVFVDSSPANLALLNSAIHQVWTISRRTTHGKAGDTTYTPSRSFASWARPPLTAELAELGRELRACRTTLMEKNKIGLTSTYSRVFDSTENSSGIANLRSIHAQIDNAVVRAYDWESRIAGVGGLDHGFHEVGRETRYTIGPAAQREVLDGLLELNHERYAEEVAQGLHDKKKGGRTKKTVPEQEGMFDAE
jgi:hypothetical protein